MKKASNYTGFLLSTVQLLLFSSFFFTTACVDNRERKSGNKLYIVTTTGMIKDAVEHVGGNHTEVIALMGPGVDPHLYKASHGDLEKLTSANLVFYNGLHLEGKMGEVLAKLSRIRPVITVSSQIPESSLRSIPGFENVHDPHIWFDVKLWEHVVKAVAEALQKYDSAHAEDYAINSKKYLLRLDSLHNSILMKIQEIPPPQRVMVTAHDAFGYFGDAYGLEVRGLQGISTMSEFGLRDVTELVNFIIKRKIKAIFIETSVSERSIDAVIEGCRQKGWPVKTGGNLYSDAMGAEGTKEGTYIGMINANVTTIVEALK